MIIPITIFQNQGFPAQDVQRRHQCCPSMLARITPCTMLVCPFSPVYRLRNQANHLDIAVRLVVAGRTFPRSASHFLRKSWFAPRSWRRCLF